jgi:pyruvate-formate lyase-activating enzyme
LASINKPVWVRLTLVPGLTDDTNVEKIAKFVAPMKNVEWVEIQPFHQLARSNGKPWDLNTNTIIHCRRPRAYGSVLSNFEMQGAVFVRTEMQERK